MVLYVRQESCNNNNKNNPTKKLKLWLWLVSASSSDAFPILSSPNSKIIMSQKWASLGGREVSRQQLQHWSSSLLSSKSIPSSTSLALASRFNGNNDSSKKNVKNHPSSLLLQEELQIHLRQLTLLNDGQAINPRSPRQVSNLLYSSNLFCNDKLKSHRCYPLGPTDKSTLMKIILNNHDDTNKSCNDCDDDNDDSSSLGIQEMQRRKNVATLVLKCRDLLSLIDGRRQQQQQQQQSVALFSSSKSTLVQRQHTTNATNTTIPTMMKQQESQIANYSSVAATSFSSSSPAAASATSNESYDINNDDSNIQETYDEVEEKNMISNIQQLPFYKSSSSHSMSAFDQMVMNLFPNVKSEKDDDNHKETSLDPYWIEPLLSLTKSSSRSLVRQLSNRNYCPMGYDPLASPFLALLSSSSSSHNISSPNSTSEATDADHNKKQQRPTTTSLLSYIRQQKQTHFNDAIMLIRVGDFYETYGVDAIMLVEHCGLNPMAGKARAGCPWKNVQSTLDMLTKAGFRVAVYEEWNGNEEEFREMIIGGGISQSSDDGDATTSAAAATTTAASKKLKTRYLAQIVSSANPTYMHGLVLKDESSDGLSSSSSSSSTNSLGRSYVGVIETKAGYTVVEVSTEERIAVVSERLTAEAVSCRLIAYPPADPLIYVPPYSDGGSKSSRSSSSNNDKRRLDRLPFLPWRQTTSNSFLKPNIGLGIGGGGEGGGKIRVKTLPPSLVVAPAPGKSDVERAKQTIVSAFLRLEDDSLTGETSETPLDEESSFSVSSIMKKRERSKVTHEDFVVTTPSTVESTTSESDQQGYLSTRRSKVTSSLPLHLETATQLGLMFDPAIPSLVSSLLPDSAPSTSRRFLRRWLLIPPPPDIADAMSQLIRTLKHDDNRALPSINAPPITGKVSSLIRAGQASASVYRELLSSLDAGIRILLLDGEGTSNGMVVAPLLEILQHDTGIETSDSETLRNGFYDTKQVIESIVNTYSDDESEKEQISYYGDVIPAAFLERNEVIWRGRVKQAALECSHEVPLAAKRLAEAVAIDFWGVERILYNEVGAIDLNGAKETKNPIVQDLFNNLIAIKSKPSWEVTTERYNEGDVSRADTKSQYFHPRDRNGKVLRTRYTTERVQQALSDYVEACENARKEVEKVLTRLSWELVDNGHLPSIMQASHLNLILSTAAHHAAHSNMKGWSTAVIEDESASAGHFEGVWPYWMDQSESIPNSFDLNGLFLLTAPNMSGKSTLMRATAAAALLINSGLSAPLQSGSSLRRFDSIFVRGASADIPTEDKSAFGAEMGDVAALLRSCGDRSLVFVDEIGRGTSPRDGTCLAAAILEKMAVSGMSGMFATHLHGILNLPYAPAAESRLKKKRMTICDDGHGHLSWTYKLEDGVCTNSLALLTAAKFGLDPSILQRAEELSAYWNTADIIEERHVHVNGHASDRNSMQDAIQILEDVVGGGTSCVPVPPSFMPPPSLEGSSCVYILQIGKNNRSRYYVGETDSLSQRLSQHRSKGDEWSSLSAVAIQIVEGKSHARNVESLVIQRMARDGFDMLSVADGTSIRASKNRRGIT